ncbi:MAG: hypothetical protein WAK14_05455 [Methanobacterium sp.]
MFIKIRRDTLIILLLAFMLILSGRVMTYMSYASSTDVGDQGVQISGIIVKGNDIVPLASIKSSLADVGFRSGSYIQGDTLVTSKRKVPLNEAIDNAKQAVMLTTIPGTQVTPIAAADVQVDKQTGIVTVNVIEDFSNIQIKGLNGTF